ncbi:MAG: CYTH domain-containing protein [Acidobacteriota bacterium]|nr:MAG: CYTH domain-containing protein [Acidobacteriota bacterium]
MKNIEIKTPIDDRARIETRLRELGARYEGTSQQKDTFFAVPRGWLKLREQTGRPAELISYVRSIDDAGPRGSDYDVVLVDDPRLIESLLVRVLPGGCVVHKQRSLWLVGHTRVHLDEVEELGEFLELETVLDGIDEAAARAEGERVIDALGLDRARFVSRPYAELSAGRSGSENADDRRFMELALAEARAAAERDGEVPVGAVLVRERDILARGRNEPLGERDPTAHAEIRALRRAARELGAARLPGTTLYVTLEPCLMCFGALIHARVERLVFAASDPKVGASRLLAMVPVGFYGLNHRIAVEGGLLATESAALLREFFRQRR